MTQSLTFRHVIDMGRVNQALEAGDGPIRAVGPRGEVFQLGWLRPHESEERVAFRLSVDGRPIVQCGDASLMHGLLRALSVAPAKNPRKSRRAQPRG